jgi:Inner membrane component of T3SS, cytoplasmic domain
VTASPTLRLVVSGPGGGGHPIDVGPGARVGSGAGADVRIPDEAVAAVAFELERGDAGWGARAAAAGLVVDGAPLAPGERAAVAPGAILVLGPVTIDVRAPGTETPAPATPERTASLARELVRELLGGPSGAELVVEVGPAAGKRLRLPPPETRIVVGRGDSAGWVVLDPRLSREHAAVDRGWDGIRVVDLGSKNGTRAGGELAPTEAPGRLVHDGDAIELGETSIRVVDPAEQYLRRLDARLDGDAPAAAVAGPAPARGVPWTAIIAIAIAAAAVAAVVWLVS